MAFFDGKVHEIDENIVYDLEVVLDYLDTQYKLDPEVARAAQKVSAYLEAYQEAGENL
jgi:DNA-directed RNA polymerase subunit F